jgi:predicted Zn-dependent protease
MSRASWIFFFALLALAGCGGGARTAGPRQLTIADVRARAAAAPNDPDAQRELAIAESLMDGGDPARVQAALERATRLAPEDARLVFLAAVADDGTGKLDLAFASYLRALQLASAGPDATSQAIAEASLSALADMMDVVPNGRAQLRTALDALQAAPGTLDLGARNLIAEQLVELAYRRGDLAAVRALAASQGCPAEWRVAGPFGPRELLGFDVVAPAQGRGPLADTYDLGPGRGVRPTRTIEPRGCAANLGGGPVGGPGTTIAEARATISRAGRYVVRLETPNSVELFVDGASVVRLDARVEPVPRTTFHFVELSAGEHELEVKLTSRHPNPILVVSLAPAVATDDAQLPADLSGRPLEAYLATNVAIARGDVVGARELAQPFAKVRGAAAPWLVVRAAIALGDPLVPSEVRRDDARALLRRALERDPSLWYPVLQMARLDAADGRAVEAIGVVKVGLERFPGVLGFYLTLADLYQSKGWTSDSDDAIRRAALAVPGACAVQRGLYDAARRRDRHMEAWGMTDALLACDARTNVRYQQLLDQRHWDEAATELARLATFEPRQNKLGFLTAELELAHQRGDEAAVERKLAEIAAESPLSPFAPLSRADRLLAAGEPAQARAVLDEALLREPASMGELRRVRRAIGGVDDLAPYRKDGAAILAAFLASGRTYTQPQVLVFDYAATRVFPDGSAMHLVHQIYRVQSDEAVNEHGEFQPPGNARILTLHTIKADGRRMEPDEIAGKETISLPSLAVGDFVESEYVTLEDPPASFPNGFIGDRFYFQSVEVPFDTTSQVYIVPRDMPIVIDPRGPAPVAEERMDGDLRVLTFTLHESRPLVPEPGSVGGREFLPSINVAVSATWEAFVDGMRDVLADRDVRDPSAERLVREILRGKESAGPEAKARTLYAWVLENVENSDAFFGSAPAMLAARTGNHVRVLRYVFALAGIPSDLVAVRSKAADITESQVADAETFANGLLRLQLPSGETWISGSERWMPFGYVSPMLRGQEGLVVAPGAPRVRVTPAPEGGERHDVVADVHLGVEGQARFDVEETFRGGGAIGWRGQLEEIPAAELQRRFEQGYVARLVPGAELQSIEIIGQDKPDQPLVVKYSFTVSDLGRRANGHWLVPGLFPLQLGESLVPRDSRTTTQFIPSDTDEHIVIRFHAADGALPAPPAAVNLRGPGGATFSWRAQRAAGVYTIERGVRIPIQRIAPAGYAALATFCRSADEAETRDTAFAVR